LTILRDGYKDSVSRTLYISANKEPKEGKPLKTWEYVLWSLAQEIESNFGFEPVTFLRIYKAIGPGFGWTDQDTREVLRRAVNHGYVIKVGKEEKVY